MNNTLLLPHFDLLATAPGGVAKLRELILTLAVQGKLVPQDPVDEPASELLKRIRAEKDRLIAAGKIKRDKPLAPIAEDEKPFGLPVGWEWVRLGDLVNLTYGKNLPTTSLTEAGFPVFGANGVIGRYGEYLYDDEQLLISCRGAYSGKPNISSPKCFVTNNSIVCEFFARQMINLGYFYRQLQVADKSRLVTGSAQPQVTIANADPLVLSLPPLPEQTRIVARVEELMRLCDALEAKGRQQAAHHTQLVSTLLGSLTASAAPDEQVDDLPTRWQRVAQHFDTLLDRPEAIDALEQTILQLAVRGQLVPQDPTDEPAGELLKRIRAEKDRLIAEGKIKRDKPLAPIAEDELPFELPRGWEWVRLRDLVTYLGDGLHGTPIYSTNGDYFFINGNNLSAGAITIKPETRRVDRAEFEKYRKPLDATSVLLSINGTLGRVAFYQDEKIILGKSACYFNVTAGFQKLFAKLLLECPDFMTYAEISATGTTIKNLGLKAIGDWPIALPPLPEQARIVARVAQLRCLCADLRQRLSASQSTQASLAEALVDTV